MKLNKLYSEQIGHLDQSIQEAIIREAPHCQIAGMGSIFKVVGDFVDLGFENLGLSTDDTRKLYKAFIGEGVIIPSPKPVYKLRYLRTGTCAIELSDGTEEVTFPEHWKQAVLILNGSVPVWIGKLVRPDQISGFDTDGMDDVGDGYMMRK